MATYSIVFVVCLLFNLIYGFALKSQDEKELEWPDEYHITGEIRELHTGINLPFELWYSYEFSRSRVDLDKTVSHYYDLEDVDPWAYGIHPVSNNKMVSEKKCYQPFLETTFLSLLLDGTDFKYTSYKNTSYGVLEQWKSTETFYDYGANYTRNQTFYVLVRDGENLPIEYAEVIYSRERGIDEQTVIIYQTLDTDFTEQDLILPIEDPTNNCKDDLKTDLKALHDLLLGDSHKNQLNQNKKYHKNSGKAMSRKNSRRLLEQHRKNPSFNIENDGISYEKDNLAAKLFPQGDKLMEQLVAELPPNFDYREEGFVTPVKREGTHCGASWAFAMVAALEIAVGSAIGSNLVDLSEQSLIDCTWAYHNKGCQGGSAVMASKFVKKFGIPAEADYGGYKGIDGECKILDTKTYNITSVVELPPDDINAIKVALYNYGPVIFTISDEGLWEYPNGIFKQQRTGGYNHPVVIVGYGNQDGEEYFIVKNSWGETWGESGYARVSTANGYYNPFTVKY